MYESDIKNVTERQTHTCIIESIIGRENPHCSN